MSTPIITLTSDWGNQGFFAAKVKGLLFSALNGIQVVDITHSIECHDVREAAFVARHGCLGFPAGTVHIVDVNSNPLEKEAFVVVKVREQYFICANNGLPTLAFGDEIEEAVSLPLQEDRIYNFAAYSLFCPTAIKLLEGTPMSALGPRVEQLRQSRLLTWVRQGDEYRIPVQYIDRFGNAYLGMTYREFVELRQGRPFAMQVRDRLLNEVVRSYYQQQSQPQRLADKSERLCLTVSATGLLELAIRDSSCERLIGVRLGDMVLLKFL